MQRLEVSGAVRPLYGSLGFKGLKVPLFAACSKNIGLEVNGGKIKYKREKDG